MNLFSLPTVLATLGLTVTVTLTTALPAPLSTTASANVTAPPWSLDNTAYGVMLDVGSSGTRVHVYQWSKSSAYQHQIEIQPVLTTEGTPFSAKKFPGMSTISPADVSKYLDELIVSAASAVPHHLHATTPIFWKATAGMRLLPDRKMKAILRAVKTRLSASPFYLHPRFGVQVISGEQEGTYGWLTLNYLRRRLAADNTTIAALDMGGASTQLTFEPTYTPLASSFPMLTNGTRKLLYTHSYLRYGADEFRRRYQASLLKDGDYNRDYRLGSMEVVFIDDPCGWKGAVDRVHGSEGEIIRLLGTGDGLQCRERIRSLMSLDSFCSQPPCAIDGVYQPEIPAEMPVYAVSNFAYTADFFGCASHAGSSPRCLLDAARDLCGRLSWREAYATWGPAGSAPDAGGDVAAHLKEICLSAFYAIEILTEGYRLPLDRLITFRDDIGGTSAGWTLGAMIAEANDLTVADYISNARHGR